MPISNDFKKEILASATPNAFFYIVEVDEPALSSPFRIVNNTVSITSNGIVYDPLGFSIVLPNKQDKIPKAKLVIDNTDKIAYNELIVKLSEEISANVSMISTIDLDIVEQGPINFKMTNGIFNKNSVIFDLTFEDNLSEIFPGYDFTPELFPGMY